MCNFPATLYHFCLQLEVYLISSGGQLVDLLRNYGKPLPCDQVLQIFYQTCRAVQHMHKQKPPITHRDLKVMLGCGEKKTLVSA